MYFKGQGLWSGAQVVLPKSTLTSEWHCWSLSQVHVSLVREDPGGRRAGGVRSMPSTHMCFAKSTGEVMCRFVVPLAMMHVADGSPSEGHKNLAFLDGGWVGIPVQISARSCTGGDKGIQGLKGSTTKGLNVRLEWTQSKRLDAVAAWSMVEGGLGVEQADPFPFPVDASPWTVALSLPATCSLCSMAALNAVF